MNERPGCLFCGGDASAPDHLLRCDGRQGQREAQAAEAPPVVELTRVASPRPTSILAFYNNVNNGTIQTRREQAWVGLAALGIATASEVFAYLKEQKRLGPRYDSNTHARMTELRDLGLIREVGTRVCRVTKQKCIAWETVPSAEYVGEAVVHRCPTCRQIVARDVPTIHRAG